MNLSTSVSTIDDNTHYFCIIIFNGSEYSIYLRKDQTLEYLVLKVFADLHYKSLNEFINDFKLIHDSKNLLADYDETRKLTDIFTDESNICLILEKKNFELENKKKYILDHLKVCLEKIDESSSKINKESLEEIIRINVEVPIANISEQIDFIKQSLKEKLQSHCENIIFLEKSYENLLLNDNLNLEEFLESLGSIRYIEFFSLVNYLKNLKKELNDFNSKLKSNF